MSEMTDESEKDESLTYLAGPEAAKSLRQDPYWPKWDSPWWRFLLLHECGENGRIPKVAAESILRSMHDFFLPAFFPEELPPGKLPAHNIGCFCALGTIFPALEAAGLDPDEALPWARAWLTKHSVWSGGLNCDDTQYHLPNPGSSIVATVAVLELFIESRSGPRNEEEKVFVDGLARDLLARKLIFAFPGTSNAEEKEDEADWRQLCFPRFYFYDLLRGLTAITRYAERMGSPISFAGISEAVECMREKSARGALQVERDAISSVGTYRNESGKWVRTGTASQHPLLEKSRAIGRVSPELEAEWAATRDRIENLRRSGLIID
jgi:hypothetical protein